MLNKDWIVTEPHDIEYKQYLLMAYEQKCNNELGMQKLYPIISDVSEHLLNVNKFIEGKNILESSHKEIKSIDFLKGKLIYESKIKDSRIDQFYDIAYWSMDIFNSVMSNGKFLYDMIEKQINVESIKWTKSDYGYLIFKSEPTKLFFYEVRKMWDSYGINIEFLKETKKIITDLSTEHPIWDISYPTDIPMDNTILPITKRIILKKHLELSKIKSI